MAHTEHPLHPARYQHRENDRIRCTLCPHHCLIAEGKRGLCKVRQVVDGELKTLVYGYPSAMATDPIEKKPLFHFHPRARTFSYATMGCNFACEFCQNWSLSQIESTVRRTRYVSPAELVVAAREDGSRIIAHTYTEPTIYFEYAFDVAREAVGQGMKNVFVTNGYMDEAPLEDVAPYLHAANVDLKAFSDRTYKRVCHGRLQPVLDTIRRMHALGIWLEVTTLVVPGMNDSPAELGEIAGFIASLSPDIPWHVSRFHPDYKMTGPGITPGRTLHSAFEQGREAGLRYIYAGNLPGNDMESTHCPDCDELLVERRGFAVGTMRVTNGACPACQTPVAGVWNPA